MRPVAIAAALLLSACATTGDGKASSRSSDVITTEQIRAATGAATAYEVVQRLRPHFLRNRTVPTPAGRATILVYIDGLRAGGLRTLRQIRAEQVLQIRYLDGPDATTKYGTGHGAGVIEVTTT